MLERRYTPNLESPVIYPTGDPHARHGVKNMRYKTTRSAEKQSVYFD